jgi:hypothetical protein
VLGISQLAPLIIPLVAASGLSTGWKAGLSTALLLGVPEVGILLAGAILGKEGFVWLKGRLFALLRRGLPPDRVGPWRHRIGVAMFTLPLLFGWLLPYLEPFLPPGWKAPLALYIAGDVLFLLSLFVLGGEFWDKLRGLFLRRATIRLRPPESP